MSTEDISPRYLDLDLWDNSEALKALYEGQLAAVAAVGPALTVIAAAVDDTVSRLRQGGRLVYVGAGTSGRIGVQDGVELSSTFNWPRDKVVFVMAGGEAALLRAIEGAEDSRETATGKMNEIGVCGNDVVIGIAASGRTPFTVSAIETARRRGALTIGIANNPDSELLRASEHPVLVDTGAEIIAGSTRLKAATAQKITLNLFSTVAMMRLGKVYRGLMVHMLPTNEKLRRRAIQIVRTITGCSEEIAAEAVAKASGDVKTAALVACGMDTDAALAMLARHEGNLRFAMAELEPIHLVPDHIRPR